MHINVQGNQYLKVCGMVQVIDLLQWHIAHTEYMVVLVVSSSSFASLKMMMLSRPSKLLMCAKPVFAYLPTQHGLNGLVSSHIRLGRIITHINKGPSLTT